MSFLYNFGSSSGGNATYIGDRSCGVLIDAGLSGRCVFSGFDAIGVPLCALQGIFITHEHSDHIKGLKTIASKTKAPVYATAEVLDFLIDRGQIKPSQARLLADETLVQDVIKVKAFDTPHDSLHSVGYCVETCGGGKATVCTDLGYMTEEILQVIAGSDLCMLESNYDENMLMVGNYPWELKQRIRGKRGHLSNEDAAMSLLRLLNEGCDNFLLAHLSKENNRPEIAYLQAVGMLKNLDAVNGSDYRLTVAAPINPCAECMAF